MLALSRFVLLLDLLRTECIWIVRIRPLVVAIRVRVERTAKEDIELTFPTSLCFTLDYMALGTTDVSGNPSTDGTMMECHHIAEADRIANEKLLKSHCLFDRQVLRRVGECV